MTSKLILICVFCLGAVLSRVAAAQDAANAGTPNTPVSDKFLGTWRLISIETIRPNGEIIYPFYGKQPDGMRKLVWERISSTLP